MYFYWKRNEHRDRGKCKNEKEINVNTSLTWVSVADVGLEMKNAVYLRPNSINVFHKNN